jgi:hypothetical protein
MDAFEQVVSEILWHLGYWVRTSVKVELTKEEKRSIGRPSSPRWEIDVVAYSARENILRLVECKSYLDSPGVKATCFDGSDPSGASRYKLFNEASLRDAVFRRVAAQLYESGACAADPKVILCLACGKIASDVHRTQLHDHFKKNSWELWDEKWLQNQLSALSKGGYENQVSSVVAKLLLRGTLPE